MDLDERIRRCRLLEIMHKEQEFTSILGLEDTSHFRNASSKNVNIGEFQIIHDKTADVDVLKNVSKGDKLWHIK